MASKQSSVAALQGELNRQNRPEDAALLQPLLVPPESNQLYAINGEDGCEGNICQVAQDIANNQPRLRVNVVDISGSGLSNCVAEHTGGRVYVSQDTEEISRLLRSSVEEVASNAACVPL
ncbi:MAG: hypothetical protein KA735_13185 [Burkholderiaceae bacterium]|nr:hypothetical protein [Burkholderiaceae bacterium]